MGLHIPKVTYLLSHHFETPLLFFTFTIMLNGLTFMRHKSNQQDKNNDYTKGNGRYQDSVILV